MLLGIGFLFPEIRNITYSFISGSQSSLETCKDGMIYQSEIINDIVNELDSEAGIPESYIATKGLSSNGFRYLLIVNYKSHSKLITYYPAGGIKVKLLSKGEGKNVFSELATTEYKNAKSYYGEPMFHDNCIFIRFSDSINRYDLEVLNPAINLDEPIIRILTKVDALLKSQYQNDSLTGTISRVSDEPSESSFDKWEDEIAEDLFFELKILNRN